MLNTANLALRLALPDTLTNDPREKSSVDKRVRRQAGRPKSYASLSKTNCPPGGNIAHDVSFIVWAAFPRLPRCCCCCFWCWCWMWLKLLLLPLVVSLSFKVPHHFGGLLPGPSAGHFFKFIPLLVATHFWNLWFDRCVRRFAFLFWVINIREANALSGWFPYLTWVQNFLQYVVSISFIYAFFILVRCFL